jgi:deferrochelatase/peroxidase EfeB
MPKSKGPVEAIATAEQEQQVLAGVALTVQQQQLTDTKEAIDRLTAANAALEMGMRSQEERHGKVLGFLQVMYTCSGECPLTLERVLK